MSAYTRPKQTDLELTRTMPAKPADVYDAWLDPKSPGSFWFGSKRLIHDVRVDGLFYVCMGHEGRDWAHYGRFVTLDRGSKIEHTWVSEGTRGLESLVSLTFEPDGEKTRVMLRHTGFPDDEFGHQHKEGWEFVLAMIEKRFSR